LKNPSEERSGGGGERVKILKKREVDREEGRSGSGFRVQKGKK